MYGTLGVFSGLRRGYLGTSGLYKVCIYIYIAVLWGLYRGSKIKGPFLGVPCAIL